MLLWCCNYADGDLERTKEAFTWSFFMELYGQTEVAPLATALQPEDQLRKLGSAGLPSLNVQTKIVNELDEEVPRGELGRSFIELHMQ